MSSPHLRKTVPDTWSTKLNANMPSNPSGRQDIQCKTAVMETSLSKPHSPLINKLPGEIRNLIIELCILGALKKPKSPSSKSKPTRLTVSVLPKWSGPGCLRMDGISALPLLFVNKQLHNEVLSYVDAMVDELSIGGYILQYPNEDPRIRWQLVYSLLKNRPSLQFARSIRVTLPRAGDKFHIRHLDSIGYKTRKVPDTQTTWLVLPDLGKYLHCFSTCETLVVVITVEESEPPNLSSLLPLYEYFQKRLTVEFDVPGLSTYQRVRMLPWLEKWKNAWDICLSNAGSVKDDK